MADGPISPLQHQEQPGLSSFPHLYRSVPAKYNTLDEPTTCRLFVVNCASGIDGQERGVGKVQEGGNTARYEAINSMDESRRAGGSDWNRQRAYSDVILCVRMTKYPCEDGVQAL